MLQVPTDEVFYFFSLTCLTAPFMGVIFGGLLFSSLGGYNSPRSFRGVLVVSIIGLFSAIPIPLVSNRYLVYLLVWITLFVGSFILPTMTGIMLNSVDQSWKPTANSLATLSYNLFGFLPAPFIYGLVSSMGKNEIFSSRCAMGCLMSATIITASLLVLGYRYKQKLSA